MNAPTALKAKVSAAAPDRKPAPRRAATTLSSDTSKEAKKRAAAILEVLAGLRLPSEAAAALGVSLPRYYLLEAQGLTGLVAGCEPRPHGRARTPERALAKLRKEVERLQREGARQQALVRAAQRTIGLTLPETPKPRSATGKKRRRRPSVRALKAAARLQSDAHRQEVAAAAAPAAPANGEGPVTLKAIP
jgi:hypothetical protein